MRRISTKLVLLVLAAVALPFLGFAVYVDQAGTLGFTQRVAQQALMGLAGDLSGRVDRQVNEAREGVELLAGLPFLGLLALSSEQVGRGDATADPGVLIGPAQDAFEDRQRIGGIYELIVLVDRSGRYVMSGRADARGERFGPEAWDKLSTHDFNQNAWFKRAIGGESVSLDQHKSDLFPGPKRGGAGDHFLGFAQPVMGEEFGKREIAGVLFVLVSWEPFQELVGLPVIQETFRGLVREGEDPSPYAWIWDRSADKIMAHKEVGLYGTRIGADLGLGAMTDAVVASRSGWGLYPPYEFRGIAKTAAFKRCRDFGWVVGVGIDNKDMFASANELRSTLRRGTLAVLLAVLLWTMVIARRITAPIHALQALTKRVAEGDLTARLEPTTRDELGELTNDFNGMTERLSEQRMQLVKAEKDAAWREMARQIAHDIKNPLTPIKLSVDLLRRSHSEDKERFEALFPKTMDLMDRQVVNLTAISQEFYEFTGGRKSRPSEFDAADLAEEVLALHGAWAQTSEVVLDCAGGGDVFVDRDKLRRVFENLATNAMHAVREKGRIEFVIHAEAERVLIEVRDDGAGISEEARQHLFEPNFTTRGEGTGLGLAIARRMIEEMQGTIDLVARADQRGSVARIDLPGA